MEYVSEMVRAYEAQKECRRNACTSAAITADTRSITTIITTFKLNAEITQLNRYTHSRVPGDVSLSETLSPRGVVRTRSSKGNCARNTRLHSFIMEAIDHVTPRESLEATLRRSDAGAVRFCVFVEVLNKGVPRLTKCHPLGHFALARISLRRMSSELMEESDKIAMPLIRHRIKVLSCSLSVINDGAAHV
ncbi:hypothetical protein PC128_g3820 [Phytophthora cactorum]|nr:hypothetical protein PC128_g3820 [Phytophthora cactorum]